MGIILKARKVLKKVWVWSIARSSKYVLLGIDLCIITILETRTNAALLLVSMNTETETFDLLVSMFGIIYVINIATLIASFKRILKILFFLKNLFFIFILLTVKPPLLN